MDFEGTVNKHRANGSYILRFLTNLKKIGQEKLTLDVYETRLALLESYWTAFQLREEELLGQKEFQKSNYAQEDFFSKVEEAYVTAKACIRQQLRSLSTTQNSDHSEPGKVHLGTGRLPKISLPTFSGDYLHWENFRDLFTSIVHEAPELSNAARLQYLKSVLVGEAASVISAIPVTDANYKDAWEALVERYDDKRILMSHYFNHLLSLKAMTVESAYNLKRLLDVTSDNRQALQNMGRPVQLWDDWFVHLTVQKLDPTSRKDWESLTGSTRQIPSYEQLKTFLVGRIRALDSMATMPRPLTVSRSKVSSVSNIKAHSVKTQQSAKACALCKGKHYVGYCPDFKQKLPQQRKDIVSRLKLCYNCLKDHSEDSCPSVRRCSLCNAKHHSLLHLEDSSTDSFNMQTISAAHAYSTPFKSNYPALLATARVRVTAPNGNAVLIRALLDQESEATFISEDLVQRLQLPRTRVHVPVSGIGAIRCGTVKALVPVQLSPDSADCRSKVSIKALVLPGLTKSFRIRRINPNSWPHLKNLKLSDVGSTLPSIIDLVIGADLYGDILLDGLVKGVPGTPVAQNTTFRWVLSGGTKEFDPNTHRPTVTTFHCSTDFTLSDELRKFLELEELPRCQPLTPDEKHCEEHFQATHTRTRDGRYVVRLPKRNDVPLGNSFQTALRSFQRAETRRLNDGSLCEAYRSFMKEYLDLDHMTPFASEVANSKPRYYLSHHAVWKTEGSTPKIRVVLNASAYLVIP